MLTFVNTFPNRHFHLLSILYVIALCYLLAVAWSWCSAHDTKLPGSCLKPKLQELVCMKTNLLFLCNTICWMHLFAFFLLFFFFLQQVQQPWWEWGEALFFTESFVRVKLVLSTKKKMYVLEKKTKDSTTSFFHSTVLVSFISLKMLNVPGKQILKGLECIQIAANRGNRCRCSYLWLWRKSRGWVGTVSVFHWWEIPDVACKNYTNLRGFWSF